MNKIAVAASTAAVLDACSLQLCDQLANLRGIGYRAVLIPAWHLDRPGRSEESGHYRQELVILRSAKKNKRAHAPPRLGNLTKLQ